MTESCVICNKPALQRCSRCKSVYYCSKEHQIDDWNLSHKSFCGKEKKNTRTNANTNSNTTINASANTNININTGEKRECRCMFCGEVNSYDSEEEAMKHMEI